MSRNTLSIARGVGVIGVTISLMVGATFAALTSNTVTLSDNTISSATASLKVWDGNTFTTTASGFHINNLIPGTPSAPFNFYFQNDGGVDLALTAVSTTPIPVGVNLSDVQVTFVNDNTGEPFQTNLATLSSGFAISSVNHPLHAGAQGSTGNPTQEGNYSVVVNIPSSAVSGPSASVPSFSITFTGTQTP